MKAVLLVSHGSHSPETKQEVQKCVEGLKREQDLIGTGFSIFEAAFLEIESPSIPDGIDLCVERGAEKVVVLLNFLNSGKHVDEDIPKIIEEAKAKYPNVKINATEPLGKSDGIVKYFTNLLIKFEE